MPEYTNEDPEVLTIDYSEIPIDSLVPAISEYDNAISTVLNVPSKSDLVLSNVYEAINQKYNLNITNKEFTDFVSTIADKSKFESSVESILGSKVISNVCSRVTLKSIVTAGALIEKSLELIEKQSANTTSTSAELIVMITKIFEWIEQLNVLKDKYESDDPDRNLERTIESMGGIINSESSTGSSTSSDANKVIKDILKGLNKKS
jgi:hypothetical protein